MGKRNCSNCPKKKYGKNFNVNVSRDAEMRNTVNNVMFSMHCNRSQALKPMNHLCSIKKNYEKCDVFSWYLALDLNRDKGCCK